MKSITIESEHWLLLTGILFIIMGLMFAAFFTVGMIACVASYAIDLTKRIKETDLGEQVD